MVRLRRSEDQVRLDTTKTGIDHTDAMRRYAARRVAGLATRELCGYVLKKNSPFDRSGFLRHAGRFGPSDLDVDLTGRVCVVAVCTRLAGLAPSSEDPRSAHA